MNTADRSIALVDAALRRRFYFVEFSPTEPPVKEVLGRWLSEHDLDEEPAQLVDRLNEEIGTDGFAIGPSYFMSRDGEAPDLDRIWQREIMPLLHEYYYGMSWDPKLLRIESPAPPDRRRGGGGARRLKALELKAWSRASAELSHAEAAAIRESGLVDVLAEPERGHWRLQSDAKIGVAVGHGWELRVHPHLDVPQLFFLLSYALDPGGWIDQRADFAAHPDLFDAMAAGFSYHALRAIEQGALRGYVHVADALPGVRGRIRFGDQLARSADLPIPIEVAYDDYTADVTENRILKSAALALLRLPRVPVQARRRLLKLRAVLDEVQPLARPNEVQVPPFTRLNERYRPALRLAELILRASSLRGSRERVASIAFTFDMNRVFEDFLSVSLIESLRGQGGEVRLQAGVRLDEVGAVSIQPDIVWRAGGRPRAVVDAKYKSLDPSGVRVEDVYQMLAYCTALDLDRGYLVYAAGAAARERTLVVRNSTRQICVRTVDVEREPDKVLGQVSDLAAEIVSVSAQRMLQS